MENETLIEKIIKLEYEMFDAVRNRDGRADCQDDFLTFHIMRSAQFHAWNEDTLESYLDDVQSAKGTGWNLPMEKYARMMESTAPGEYEEIKNALPPVSGRKRKLVAEIMDVIMPQTEAFMRKYPAFLSASRPVYSSDDPYFTSIETYQAGELFTYSEKTLRLYRDWIVAEEREGRSTVERIYAKTAELYGYDSIAAAEASLRRNAGMETQS